MAYFDWNEKLSTSIPVIDNQHKELISFVNKLHEAMLMKKAKEVVGEILKGLKEYTKYHFSTEEKAFHKYGYSEMENHIKEHANLITEVEKLESDYLNGKIAISVNVFEFLTKWVTNHIMKEDMKYVSLLKDKIIEEV